MNLKSTFTLSTLLLTSLVSGCSKESGSGTTFGAPNIGAIVDAAIPSRLKGASASLRQRKVESWLGLTSAFATSATCTSGASADSSGCATASNYIDFLRSEVFEKATGVSGTQYYRYWVDVLDTAMSQTNSRLAEDTTPPACLDQTPVSVNYSFNVNGQSVTVTQKLQCWEQQTAPGATSQNMAFGKDSEYFYLVYRTDDNALTNGSGERYVIAKATIDGNQAEIWFVGAGCQVVGGGSCSSRSDFKVNAQRVLANKSTGQFTFNSVEDDSLTGYIFNDFYGNTDGTNLYLEAGFARGGTLFDVTGMTSAGNGANNCILTSDLSSAGTCTSLGRSSMPANFGLTAPMRNKHSSKWQADASAKSAYLTALQAIADIDYTAQGVGKFE